MYYIKLISLILSFFFLLGTIVLIFRVLKLKKQNNVCSQSKEKAIKTIHNLQNKLNTDINDIQRKLILIQGFDCLISHAKKMGFKGKTAQEILNNILSKYVPNIEKLKENYLVLIESVSSNISISQEGSNQILTELKNAINFLYDM
jgi:hypothetical protein